MYTKCIQREVTISMATKKTRKRKTSSAKKRTRTRMGNVIVQMALNQSQTSSL